MMKYVVKGLRRGLILAVAGAGLLTGVVQASEGAVEPAGRVDLTSAVEGAVRSLKDQVDSLPIGARMSVGQYLDIVDKAGGRGNEFMIATLRRAQLIGGPRLGTDGTVEVRLDISGQIVADALAQVAATNAHRSPYSADFVARETRVWVDRVFSSAAPVSAVSAQQVAGGSGAGASRPVSAVASQGAVEAARRSAASGLVERLASAEMPAALPPARDLVVLPGVNSSLKEHVLALPVRSVEVREDGEVRVTVPLDRALVFDTFKSAVMRSTGPGGPGGGVGAVAGMDEAAWLLARDPILRAIPEELVGRALPNRTGGGSAAVRFATDRPPDWFFSTVDAEGKAAFAGSKLMTGRAAELEAMRALRQEIGKLPLGSELNIEAAVSRDPRLEGIVRRAVERARVYRVEYGEDGSAAVRVSTDPRYLWQDLVTYR